MAGVQWIKTAGPTTVYLNETGFDEAIHALKIAAVAGADLRPVYERFGRYMKDVSIPENFRRRGRPIPWKKVVRWGDASAEPLRDQGFLLNSVGWYVDEKGLVLGAGNKSTLRYAKLQQYGGFVKPKKKYLAIPCVPPLTVSEARTTWARDWMGKGTWIMHGPDGFGVYRKSLQVIASRRPTKAKPFPTSIYAKGTPGVEMIFRLVPQVYIPSRPFLLFQQQDLANFAKAVIAHLIKSPSAEVSRAGIA